MISDKQKQILAFPYMEYDALIADGAIRSGKTVFMTVSFIDDAMRRFNHKQFAICGKTVDSTIKNIINPYLGLSYAREKYSIKWRKSEKLLIVSAGRVTNTFEIFGGKDESSFSLIQGRTLAGVLLDEVALQPRSFVEQAIARCSVNGSKLWFNCNPASPQHWFYEEWILKKAEKNAYRIHFMLEDNPSLSEQIINRYKAMYSGVFYSRYILGEWCVAEGLVYDFGEENITDEIPENGDYFVSIDYGTVNPFAVCLWCVLGDKATMIKELYYNSRKEAKQKTDTEYVEMLKEFVKGYDVRKVIVDPSAASFIEALHRTHQFSVIKGKNEVIDGIRRVASYLNNGNIKVHRSCVNMIAEFGLYRWDDKASDDRVIKENDHLCDSVRYFANTILRYRVKRGFEN